MNKMDLSLLISTIFMLKQSILKDNLFKIMKKLNKLSMQNNFNESMQNNFNESMQNNFNESMKYNLNEDVIEDINILLENMDDWIRYYNSEIRMSIKKELMNNLVEIKRMFYFVIK